MRATTLLETQHRKVEAMFRKLEAGAAESAQIVRDLALAVAGHMVIEEEIFYPEARKVRADLVPRNEEEHETQVCEMKRLLASQPGDARFAAQVKVLKDLVAKHVRSEERQLFPSVAKAFGEAQNEALGRVMEARFNEVLRLGLEGAMAERQSVAAEQLREEQEQAAEKQRGKAAQCG